MQLCELRCVRAEARERGVRKKEGDGEYGKERERERERGCT